jgi:GTP-binding protein
MLAQEATVFPTTSAPLHTAAELAAGEALFARQWCFSLGVPRGALLPATDRSEIAFAGRSNVGKSSLINALVGQHRLARTARTPGRTQELNFFTAPGVALYLVDMPGYGFAKAPRDQVAAWTRLLKDYLRGRPTLMRVFLLVDARHGLKDGDRDIMELMDAAGVSYQAVLTKVDKLKAGAVEAMTTAVLAGLAPHAAAGRVVRATSAHTGLGIAELRADIAELAKAHGALH